MKYFISIFVYLWSINISICEVSISDMYLIHIHICFMVSKLHRFEKRDADIFKIYLFTTKLNTWIFQQNIYIFLGLNQQNIFKKTKQKTFKIFADIMWKEKP